VSLTAKDVAQITRLLEESNFDELYLEIDGLKLSLRRGSATNAQSVVDPAAAVAPSPAPPAPSPAPPATPASPAAGAVPRGGSDPGARADSSAVSDANTRTDPGALAARGTLADLGTPAAPNTLTVSAPLLGTFYRAPKPGAAPFVEVGSLVREDTIVGIIEVMKLMNTVRAGVRGEVTQILGRDGALVEYGETLLHVSKTS
jgi:acetyl-CoA carboxylase biotin carboxyl carrier protein